jgi:hypothetical protein
MNNNMTKLNAPLSSDNRNITGRRFNASLINFSSVLGYCIDLEKKFKVSEIIEVKKIILGSSILKKYEKLSTE